MSASRFSRLVASVGALGLLSSVATQASITGQWDFNSGDLSATIGTALDYRGTTAAGTVFGTTTSFGIPDIGGVAASVMQFPATTIDQGFTMAHGAAANGGGAYVNQYSIVYDLYWPTGSIGVYRSLLQTAPSNPSGNDGDLFVNPAGGIGIGGNYQGNLDDGAWHRVGFALDMTAGTLAKYIDGTQVGLMSGWSSSAVTDGRWALGPTALLFADEDGETAMGYVNSIAFFDTALSAADLATLGGPTAAGIPEPSTLSLGLLALAGWVGRKCLKRAA